MGRLEWDIYKWYESCIYLLGVEILTISQSQGLILITTVTTGGGVLDRQHMYTNTNFQCQLECLIWTRDNLNLVQNTFWYSGNSSKWLILKSKQKMKNLNGRRHHYCLILLPYSLWRILSSLSRLFDSDNFLNIMQIFFFIFI